MAEFINTIDVLGDDAVIDSIIDRTITEFKDDGNIILSTNSFRGCTQLGTVWLPNATFFSSTGSGFDFCDCTSLNDVRIPSATSLPPSCFAGCTALQNIVLPGINNRLYASVFDGCTSLRMIDIYKTFTCYGNFHFRNCSSLVALVLRGDAVSTLGSTASFTNTPIASGTGYIYVPGSLVNSYKSATNWSTYASQFRAIEDYTIDGTTTGELDETKI